MSTNYLTREETEAIKRDQIRLMSKIGIDGLMQLLTEITEEFGEGDMPNGNRIAPDATWLAVSAQLSRASDEIGAILQSAGGEP